MAFSFTGFRRSEPPADKAAAHRDDPTHAVDSRHVTVAGYRKSRITVWGWVLVGGLSCLSLLFTVWTLNFSRDVDSSAYSDGGKYYLHLGGSSGLVFTPRNLVDLEVYQAGARAIVHHHALYDGTFPTSERPLPFTYPPFCRVRHGGTTCCTLCRCDRGPFCSVPWRTSSHDLNSHTTVERSMAVSHSRSGRRFRTSPSDTLLRANQFNAVTHGCG